MKLKLIIAFLLTTNLIYSQGLKKLLGDTSLPSSKYELKRIADFETRKFQHSVEDYFSTSKASSFKLSPNGEYISYIEKNEKGERYILAKQIKTNNVKKVVEENNEVIQRYWWASNNRILFMKDKGGDENYHIYGINIDGSNYKDLTPYDNVTVHFLMDLNDTSNSVIVEMNKDNPQIFEPYSLNIVTGDLKKLYENKDLESPVDGYDFDKNGTLRAIKKQIDGNKYQLWYRANENYQFELVETTNWKVSFGILGFNYNSSNPNEAFVYSNINSDKIQIVRYDLKEKKELEVLYKNDTFDIASLYFSKSRKFEPDYYEYEGEKNVKVPISGKFKELFGILNRKFVNKNYYIKGKTSNEDKFLIYANSDKLFGSYYLYDSKSKTVKLLSNLLPNLNEADMAKVKPISFTSRDGTKIYGYVTLPCGNKKHPLIVNPHGGPFGIRDTWEFNPEAQLFASRGYATLQVNFRGSGGYGKAFREAGHGQVGRKMIDDLEDGIQYLNELGLIDEKRIAIYGGSYGGLATLQSLVKTPNLYKCGIDYIGISNLFTYFETIPEYWKPYIEEIYEEWYNPKNEADRKIMTEVSPALNADKITKPLFIAHGANDPRVNINEADKMVLTLRNRGVKVPYLVKYNEGHGFNHEENLIEFYKIMMGFLYINLK